MPDMQKMIDGSVTPVAPHCSDVVVCSDGSECLRPEALVDCAGKFHCTEEERHDADVAIVTEELDAEAKWCEEYCTENDDYADSYFGCVSENSHRWPDPVDEWVQDNWDDLMDNVDFDDCPRGEITAMVCDELDAGFDCEVVSNKSDYGRYSGSGCCLDGFKIEEYESQIDVNDRDVLRDLHEQGRLDDVLDDYNGDAYVSRSRRRERVKCRNCAEKIGSEHTTGCALEGVVEEDHCYYEGVGRKTYDAYPSRQFGPTFEIYVSISGGWDFVVPAERMTELFYEALVKWAGYDD